MQLKFLPSFVKRKGRITKKQTHSLSSLSEFSVKSVQEVEDFSKHFDKCYLEIGFGNAENIIFQAINNPSYLFIGSEVYMSGIGTLVSSIKENNINNIKIFSEPSINHFKKPNSYHNKSKTQSKSKTVWY